MRCFAFTLVFVLLSGLGYAQQVTSNTDPSMIERCEGKPPSGTLWEPPYVGVARLIPAVTGKNAVEVAQFIKGPADSDILTRQQRAEMEQAHLAIQLSATYLFYTPEGVDYQKGPQDLPRDFAQQLNKAADGTHSEVLPCGYVFQAGLTYRSRVENVNGKTMLLISVLKGPVVVWWHQKGVFTPDRKPGIKVTVTKPMTPSEPGSPYEGVPVELVIVDICGNVTARISHYEETTVVGIAPSVEAPSPPPEPLHIKVPEGIVLPPEPRPVPVVASGERGHKWCTGKKNGLICAGIIGTAFALVYRGNSSTPPSQGPVPAAVITTKCNGTTVPCNPGGSPP